MIRVRKLEAGDDIRKFRCGNADLDRWIQRHGLANQHLYGVTYLALDGDDIVGFVTVSASSVEREQLGGKTGPRSWPVLLLGRMGVREDRKHQGIGARLMRHVFECAREQHLAMGCAAVVVDAKPDAVEYYRRYMFTPMPVVEPASSQTRMYLEMGTVLAAMAST